MCLVSAVLGLIMCVAICLRWCFFQLQSLDFDLIVYGPYRALRGLLLDLQVPLVKLSECVNIGCLSC